MASMRTFDLYEILCCKVPIDCELPTKAELHSLMRAINSEKLPHNFTYAIILQYFLRAEKATISCDDIPYGGMLNKDQQPVLTLKHFPPRLVKMLIQYATMNKERLSNDRAIRTGGIARTAQSDNNSDGDDDDTGTETHVVAPPAFRKRMRVVSPEMFAGDCISLVEEGSSGDDEDENEDEYEGEDDNSDF